MYEKLDISENVLKVLSLFTKGFETNLYIREVERALEISPRTAQLILENLEKKGVLESKTRGKIRLFSLKKNNTSSIYTIFAEEYKLLNFIQKRPLISDIISEIFNHVEGMGMIFGSYANFSENKKSDLDIFIVGGIDKAYVENISRKYRLDINVKSYPNDLFKKNLDKDIILKEVLSNHIVFKGVEELIRMVMTYHEDGMVQEKKGRSKIDRT